MEIFPAIDIKDGKCVRLTQGKFDNVTVYYENPVEVAALWYEKGAKNIHIVDLDGALMGKTTTNEIIEQIATKFDMKIQTGGGIRSLENIKTKLDLGVDRVILGTVAVKNPEIVRQAVEMFGSDRIVVGVDAKEQMVATEGWEDISQVTDVDLCLKMKEYGVKTIVYTDISKDGMMCGPNIKSTKNLAEKTGLNVIASGGVSSYEDLENLYKENIYGVIIGKALYNKTVDLKEVTDKYQKG